MYKRFTKRLLDFVIATMMLVALSPIFLLLTFALFIANNGRPFFVQIRPGRNSRLFKIIKFRTMNDKEDAEGILLPDNERLTILGKFIRKTSLDEIPQLLNVIKGDMSLIGPRPLLIEYLPLYNEVQKKRHNIKPGITGWAQVNGRNAIGWQQKFEYDIFYVQHLSFALDMKILLLTIAKVFKSEGISADGEATMQKFTGKL